MDVASLRQIESFVIVTRSNFAALAKLRGVPIYRVSLGRSLEASCACGPSKVSASKFACARLVKCPAKPLVPWDVPTVFSY